MRVLTLPYKFTPREYQLPFFRAMDNGKKRAVLLNHRRAGKDKSAFNFMVKEAMKRVGVYYYFFPTYNQGRKILWDGIDKDGFKFLDHIPKQIRDGDPNSTEMKIRLVNGSLIQVVGSDNIDSIVGTNPVGCVFSEYPLQDPKGWEFVRPILRENGGWAVFPYTPRGKNHGYDLYEMARNNPDWYCEKLTIEDTYGRGAMVGPEDIKAERDAGMSENLIQQEYFVSFDAAVEYAVFGEQVFRCREEARVTRVPHDARIPVDTFWDIGRDGTAVWFIQSVRSEVRVIEYYDSYQSDITADLAQMSKRPYKYGTMWFPHDGDYKNYSTGKTPKEIATELGFEVQIVPRIDKQSQITAARVFFNRCWFDEEKTKRGFDALSSWHFGYDTKLRVTSALPQHDWCFAAGTLVRLAHGKFKKIQDISVHDEVLTPFGNRKILRSGIVRMTDKWTNVLGLRCTPEHRFFTNRGLVTAADLQPLDKFWTQDALGLRILGLLCVVLRLGFKDAITLATHVGKPLENAPFSYTGWCMKLLKAKSRQVMKFITSMMIHITTIPITWQPCRSLFTVASTNPNPAINASARFAESHSDVIKHSGQDVVQLANDPTMQGLNESAAPAYSLTVDRDECYFVLAHDGRLYLVSNSSHAGDAFCQAAMSHEEEQVWKKDDRYYQKPKKTRSWMAA